MQKILTLHGPIKIFFMLYIAKITYCIHHFWTSNLPEDPSNQL